MSPTASDTSENSDDEKPHTGPPDLIDEDEESKDSSESEVSGLNTPLHNVHVTVECWSLIN